MLAINGESSSQVSPARTKIATGSLPSILCQKFNGDDFLRPLVKTKYHCNREYLTRTRGCFLFLWTGSCPGMKQFALTVEQSLGTRSMTRHLLLSCVDDLFYCLFLPFVDLILCGMISRPSSPLRCLTVLAGAYCTFLILTLWIVRGRRCYWTIPFIAIYLSFVINLARSGEVPSQ